MLKLYDLEISGNAYKARLFLSLLNLPHELIHVDVLGGAHKKPDFLAINPKGQVPALVDDDVIINDSQAILVYLAEKYEPKGRWYPEDAEARGHIQYWLSTAANEVARGPADARLVKLLGAKIDYEHALTIARNTLALIENELTNREWLVGATATLADIAVFPYVALSNDAAISLDAYPHIQSWMARITELPGFIPMPGIPAAATV